MPPNPLNSGLAEYGPTAPAQGVEYISNPVADAAVTWRSAIVLTAGTISFVDGLGTTHTQTLPQGWPLDCVIKEVKAATTGALQGYRDK